MELGLPLQITKKENKVWKLTQGYITLMRKPLMNQADFKKYADRELVKCQRYKQIWKRATNPTIKSKAFFAWCIKRFQLQQILSYSPEPITPYNDYSMNQAVGYFENGL